MLFILRLLFYRILSFGILSMQNNYKSLKIARENKTSYKGTFLPYATREKRPIGHKIIVLANYSLIKRRR